MGSDIGYLQLKINQLNEKNEKLENLVLESISKIQQKENELSLATQKVNLLLDKLEDRAKVTVVSSLGEKELELIGQKVWENMQERVVKGINKKNEVELKRSLNELVYHLKTQENILAVGLQEWLFPQLNEFVKINKLRGEFRIKPSPVTLKIL